MFNSATCPSKCQFDEPLAYVLRTKAHHSPYLSARESAAMPVIIHQLDRVSDVNIQRKGGSSDDEVIYLGSVTRRRAHQERSCIFHSTVANAAGERAADRNTNNRARSSNHTPRLSEYTSQRGAASTTPRSCHKSSTSRRRNPIPPHIVDTLVKLGWSRSLGGRRRAVYGCFSSAGRFCYWLNAEKSVQVAQKNVEYAPRFRGMTRQQVRAEVYRVLEGKINDTGEV